MSSCRCGRHISIKKTLFETVKQCKDNEKCCQIFLGNAQSYITRNVPRDDVVSTKEYLAEKDMKMYVHANYLINMAREGDDSIVEKGRECLQKTINTLYSIGPEHTGTIFHCGAKGSVEKLYDTLNSMEILVPTFCENSAGEGSKIGKDIDELRRIIEGTDSHLVGVCIDTCHAFSSAMTDFREMDSVDKLFEDLTFLGKRPLIFHLNDSLTPLGGRADRHATLGFGQIWNVQKPETINTLYRFYQHTKQNCNDIIFETPNELTSYLEADLYEKF